MPLILAHFNEQLIYTSRPKLGMSQSNPLVILLLHLDKKLSTGGVDDSNGTVSGFMEQVVNVLVQYAELDLSCIQVFKTLQNRSTVFGWEEPLVRLIEK